MRGQVQRAFVVLAALGLALCTVQGAVAAVERSWVARYEGISDGEDVPRAIALSADGERLFVTGFSLAGRYVYDGARADYATVSYDSGTGEELWASRYDGPTSRWDAANAVALTPDASVVLVTGGSRDASRDIVTLAYDAGSGATIWIDRFDGASHLLDTGRSIAVAPDGSTAYVTGHSIVGFTPRGNRVMRLVTIAYDVTTGAREWVARYDGAGRHNYAFGVEVAPDGASVIVAGWGDGGGAGTAAEVVAYDAGSGAQRWDTRYRQAGSGGAAAYDLAIAPGAATVYVTGSSGDAFGTFALDAATGDVAWSARAGREDYASADSIALSPDGSQVYVAGWGYSPTGAEHLRVVAYDADDGERSWTRRQDGAGGEAVTVAAAPGGRTVYLVGTGRRSRSGPDFVSVAFAASSGAARWIRFYDGGSGRRDDASSAVAGAGGHLYVAGEGVDVDGRGFTTVAYRRR